MESTGVEPVTSSLRTTRSPSWATAPGEVGIIAGRSRRRQGQGEENGSRARTTRSGGLPRPRARRGETSTDYFVFFFFLAASTLTDSALASLITTEIRLPSLTSSRLGSPAGVALPSFLPV